MKVNSISIDVTPYRYGHTDDIELRITVRTPGQVHNTQAVMPQCDFVSNYDVIMAKLTDELRKLINSTDA